MSMNRWLMSATLALLAGCSGGGDEDTGGATTGVDTAVPSTNGTPGPTGTNGGPTGSTNGSNGSTNGTTGGTTECSNTVDIDVGVGEFVFEPLDDETDGILVVFGPQGGWHIDIAGAVSGTGQEVAVEAPIITLVDEGIQIAGGNEQPTYLPLTGYDPATCTGTFAGARTFVDDHLPDIPYDAWVCSLEGDLAEVVLTVSDLNTMEITGTNAAIGTIVLDETFKQETCR